MHSTRKVKDDLIYVGGSDRRLSRFENLFPIPKGYPITAMCCWMRKTVLFDTADESISRQYIENVVHALNGRPLDYMVVQHMEPDHCAMIDDMLRRYPEAKMVCSAKAVGMFAQFYWNGRCRACTGRQGRRQAVHGRAYPAFCHGADGALAGGHGHLRREGQDPVLC